MLKINSILYVEDEKGIQEELSEVVKRFCNTLYLANNGVEGLKLYKKHLPELIISDIRMPHMDGLEMVKKIKKLNNETYIIFTTAFNDTQYFQKAIELQVNGYILKPIKLDLLEQKILDIIDHIDLKKKLYIKEQMLIEQSKMAAMGEMISAIAHQWRQPLNSIGFIMQDIISAYKHNEFNNDYLEEVKKEIMRQLNFMSDTIDQFRNYFKKDDPYKKFNILKCYFDTNMLYQAQLKNHGLKLKLSVNNKNYEDLSKDEINAFNIFNQESQLKQVLINLISNSKEIILELDNIKEEQKTISVEILDNNKDIDIKVNDLAGGIDKNTLKRIFEPYYTTKDMGTGLGLYICKMIIMKNFKGDINYKDNYEEIGDDKLCGSSFIISIPKVIQLD